MPERILSRGYYREDIIGYIFFKEQHKHDYFNKVFIKIQGIPFRHLCIND